MINLDLAKSRNLSAETILDIERLHAFRDALHNSLKLLVATKQRKMMYQVGQMLFDVEEALQTLWGFGVDSRYYKFWNVPCCSCSKMDNNDAYPTGYYTIHRGCWLHSEEV